MDDVHVSFEQAVQRLLHMYSTERSGTSIQQIRCVDFTALLALNSQIAELQETLSSNQDQLDQIAREKNELYER